MTIYLDGFSSSPLAPEVRAAMEEQWIRQANASSGHKAGQEAADSIARSRSSIARLISADPAEILFTSGATEANNLALLGVARASSTSSSRRQIVVSAIEHSSILEPARQLKREEFDVVVLPVTEQGIIDLSQLEKMISDQTLLVSVMTANNETGIIQPVAEIARLCRKVGALVHTDAAQAGGKIPLDVFALDVDYMSLSAHKMYGPQGVGALYVSAAAPPPAPLMFGGGQEAGRRSGTLPVALLAGFGAASDLALSDMTAASDRLKRAASDFVATLKRMQVRVIEVGEGMDRLPGSLALRFEGLDGDDISQVVGQEILLTTGSACSNGEVGPSHVLAAMSMSPSHSKEFLRVMFGRFNKVEDVAVAAGVLANAVHKLKVATGELNQ